MISPFSISSNLIINLYWWVIDIWLLHGETEKSRPIILEWDLINFVHILLSTDRREKYPNNICIIKNSLYEICWLLDTIFYFVINTSFGAVSIDGQIN